MRSMTRKGIGSELGQKLVERIGNPVNFKPLTQDLAHGYEADVLVDVCKAIIKADEGGKLTQSQHGLAIQAGNSVRTVIARRSNSCGRVAQQHPHGPVRADRKSPTSLASSARGGVSTNREGTAPEALLASAAGLTHRWR